MRSSFVARSNQQFAGLGLHEDAGFRRGAGSHTKVTFNIVQKTTFAVPQSNEDLTSSHIPDLQALGRPRVLAYSVLAVSDFLGVDEQREVVSCGLSMEKEMVLSYSIIHFLTAEN
jgi:hypothetical protein